MPEIKPEDVLKAAINVQVWGDPPTTQDPETDQIAERMLADFEAAGLALMDPAAHEAMVRAKVAQEQAAEREGAMTIVITPTSPPSPGFNPALVAEAYHLGRHHGRGGA